MLGGGRAQSAAAPGRRARAGPAPGRSAHAHAPPRSPAVGPRPSFQQIHRIETKYLHDMVYRLPVAWFCENAKENKKTEERKANYDNEGKYKHYEASSAIYTVFMQ